MVNKLSIGSSALVAGRKLIAMLVTIYKKEINSYAGSNIQATDKSDTWHSNITLRRQLRASQGICNEKFITSDLFLILQQ